MRATFLQAELDGIKLIQPLTVFDDERGDDVETFNRDAYRDAGIATDFKKDDYATSHKHVLREMHGDDKTEKLVNCPYDKLHFVALQADENNVQYMKWVSTELSISNRTQVYLPAKISIGYLVLSDVEIFQYRQPTYHHETKQFTIKWSDERASIAWLIEQTIRSERDAWPSLDNQTHSRAGRQARLAG